MEIPYKVKAVYMENKSNVHKREKAKWSSLEETSEERSYNYKDQSTIKSTPIRSYSGVTKTRNLHLWPSMLVFSKIRAMGPLLGKHTATIVKLVWTCEKKNFYTMLFLVLWYFTSELSLDCKHTPTYGLSWLHIIYKFKMVSLVKCSYVQSSGSDLRKSLYWRSNMSNWSFRIADIRHREDLQTGLFWPVDHSTFLYFVNRLYNTLRVDFRSRLTMSERREKQKQFTLYRPSLAFNGYIVI